MKLKKNLVLVGMMGSGKSTIGKLVAKNLNYDFYDIDQLIEEQMKMKINEIFKLKGENFFRNLEEEVTLEILNLKNSVVALGGGGFINDNIRQEAIKKNETFWLDWNLNTLINRIRRNNKRPIALSLNNFELKNLILKRSKYYSKAENKINCEKLSKSEIMKKIIKLYANKKN